MDCCDSFFLAIKEVLLNILDNPELIEKSGKCLKIRLKRDHGRFVKKWLMHFHPYKLFK
jgi:hypothetical protein